MQYDFIINEPQRGCGCGINGTGSAVAERVIDFNRDINEQFGFIGSEPVTNAIEDAEDALYNAHLDRLERETHLGRDAVVNTGGARPTGLIQLDEERFADFTSTYTDPRVAYRQRWASK